MPSMKPAEIGDKQYYINLLHIYLPNLCKRMDVKTVIPELASLGLLNLGKRHSYSHFIYILTLSSTATTSTAGL